MNINERKIPVAMEAKITHTLAQIHTTSFQLMRFQKFILKIVTMIT